MYPFLKKLFANSGCGTRTSKRRWQKSCLTSQLKSSSAPIMPKDLWCSHAVGSSSAPLLGSTAAEGSSKIGRTSTTRRSHSYASPQSASCSENFVIPLDVPGRTLRGIPSKRRLRNRTLPSNRWWKAYTVAQMQHPAQVLRAQPMKPPTVSIFRDCHEEAISVAVASTALAVPAWRRPRRRCVSAGLQGASVRIGLRLDWGLFSEVSQNIAGPLRTARPPTSRPASPSLP